MRLAHTLFCAVVVLAFLTPQAGAADPQAVKADDQILDRLRLSTTGPELLDYFRKRTFPETNPDEIAALVQKLGAGEFRTREKAYAYLLDFGPSALAGLKQVQDTTDAEIRGRAADLRHRIEEKADPSVQAATARLIGHRKPAGAADVLLAYLPFAADDHVVNEICKALGEVVVRDGKPEAVVVEAVKDRLSIKRGAAAEALLRANVRAEFPALRQLLKDPDPRVRLRVALSFVPHKERDAIPALIDVLAYLAPEQLWAVEEVLFHLAGEQTPSVSLGTDDLSRKRCQQAWQQWWTKNQKTIDLTKLDRPVEFLGYTLLVTQSFNRVVNGKLIRAGGEVSELGPKQNLRWKFALEPNQYPVDAQILGNDKVLVTEFNGRRVTERDFKGNISWTYNTPNNPLSAQRLPNGNTFVVMQNRLGEVDRTGKEVWHLDRPTHDLFRGRKLRNGDVVFITNQGNLTRLDPATNKELKSFNVGQMGNLWGGFDVLANGNIVVPQFANHRVVEYDGNGREVWQAHIQLPTAVSRLPSGNTLVTSLNTRRVVELDRQGREVWGYTADGQLFLARRR